MSFEVCRQLSKKSSVDMVTVGTVHPARPCGQVARTRTSLICFHWKRMARSCLLR